MISEDSIAPDFTLEESNGTKHTLSTMKGHKILLYFYPKDDTPGCTIEACNFRDNIKEFEKLNIQLFGIGKGDKKSHLKFTDKFNLTFPLLIDTDLKISNKYDVLKAKSMFGKKYMGIERSTFLIDENGKIQKIWRNVNPLTHINEILEYIITS